MAKSKNGFYGAYKQIEEDAAEALQSLLTHDFQKYHGVMKELIESAVEAAQEPVQKIISPKFANKFDARVNHKLLENEDLERKIAVALGQAIFNQFNQFHELDQISDELEKVAFLAMLDARDYRGNTPLYYAVWYHGNPNGGASDEARFEIANLLLENGADAVTKDRTGRGVLADTEEEDLQEYGELIPSDYIFSEEVCNKLKKKMTEVIRKYNLPDKWDSFQLKKQSVNAHFPDPSCYFTNKVEPQL